MGISVVGAWELGYNAPLTEAPFWSYVLREFNITDWWMWPVSGIRNSEENQGVHLEERNSLPEILSEVSGTRVFVEAQSKVHPVTMGSDWLHDFEHPDDAIYIFGSAYHNSAVQSWSDGDLQLSIKTEQDRGVLWPHQCLLTILHDRMVKSWP